MGAGGGYAMVWIAPILISGDGGTTGIQLLS